MSGYWNMFYSFNNYLFILLFTYKLIFKDFRKISACYISIERHFIAEYSAINLYQVTSLDSLDNAPLKPGTNRTTRVVDGSEKEKRLESSMAAKVLNKTHMKTILAVYLMLCIKVFLSTFYTVFCEVSVTYIRRKLVQCLMNGHQFLWRTSEWKELPMWLEETL